MEWVQRERFDLILMDCQMPVMDGFEATRKIREWEDAQTEARPRLPVIAVTAHALNADRQNCLEAGMDDHMSKPFSRSQLEKVLERWVFLRATPRESGTSPDGTVRGSSPVGDAVLDPEIVAELKTLAQDSGDELLTTVMHTYFDTTQKQMDELERAVEERAADTIASVAHCLKSSSGTVGALGLFERCKVIEQEARDGELSRVDDRLDEIRIELARVRDALRAELEV